MTAKPPLDVPALFPEITQIGDAALRGAIERIWQRLWQESAFEGLEDVPVSASIPYPHIRHNQAIVKSVIAVARIYTEVHGAVYNMDHLIAAALLADASKLVEIEFDGNGGYRQTPLGKRLPHAMYAAHLALKEGVPLDVVHCIATHSPSSGKAPNTMECHLLHWLDQADICGFGFDIWKRRVIHHQ